MSRARYDGVVIAAPVTIPYVRYSTRDAHWFLGRALHALLKRSGVAKAIREVRPNRKPVFICHDLTRETRGYLVDDLLDVVIDQNARLIAEQSVIRLLGSIASSAPYLTKKFIEPRLIFKENVPVQ